MLSVVGNKQRMAVNLTALALAHACVMLSELMLACISTSHWQGGADQLPVHSGGFLCSCYNPLFNKSEDCSAIQLV
jgi:hypothetical protein